MYIFLGDFFSFSVQFGVKRHDLWQILLDDHEKKEKPRNFVINPIKISHRCTRKLINITPCLVYVNVYNQFEPASILHAFPMKILKKRLK